LCTQGGIINHIEVGEDVNKSTGSDDADLLGFPWDQKMADIDTGLSGPFTLFGTGANAVLDAFNPANTKGCAECHDRKGTWVVSTGHIANLFGPVAPAVIEGTFFTNDPAVARPHNQPPNVQTALGTICTGIANSTQLHNSRIPGLQNFVHNLCEALLTKSTQ
jgi:hypothetical protein